MRIQFESRHEAQSDRANRAAPLGRVASWTSEQDDDRAARDRDPAGGHPARPPAPTRSFRSWVAPPARTPGSAPRRPGTSPTRTPRRRRSWPTGSAPRAARSARRSAGSSIAKTIGRKAGEGLREARDLRDSFKGTLDPPKKVQAERPAEVKPGPAAAPKPKPEHPQPLRSPSRRTPTAATTRRPPLPEHPLTDWRDAANDVLAGGAGRVRYPARLDLRQRLSDHRPGARANARGAVDRRRRRRLRADLARRHGDPAQRRHGRATRRRRGPRRRHPSPRAGLRPRDRRRLRDLGRALPADHVPVRHRLRLRGVRRRPSAGSRPPRSP